MRRRMWIGLFCILSTGLASLASAQWATQSVTLQPGWNAVHLEVNPEPNDADALLAGIPVQSVWMWNRRFRPAQFLVDPDTLLPDDPDWLVYFPPASPQAGARSLHILQGGKSYLVRLGGAAPVTLDLTGVPVDRPPQWIADSFNLVGFSIDGQQPPTLGDFFSGSTAHQTQEFYRLTASGDWVATDPSEAMRPGEALWVYAQGGSVFDGPLTTDLRPGGALDFGPVALQLSLTVRNNSDHAKTIRIALETSADPPASGDAPLAGPVPLSWFNPSAPGSGGFGDWAVLSSSAPAEFDLAAGGTSAVRLAVRRHDFAPPASAGAVQYQSLLNVTDGEGSRRTIPVRAEGPGGGASARLSSSGSTDGAGGSRASLQTAGSGDPAVGLWVGVAVLDQVSQPTNVNDRLTPKAASGEFPFRLILHVDANHKVRLLQQVTVMSKTENGQTRPVLVTDDALVSQFDGIFERDGSLVGQRISSAAFPFFHVTGEPAYTEPQLPGGSFENGDMSTTETLQFAVDLSYDDPLNPFVHRFHPDHDNLDPTYKPWPAAVIDGKESWTVRRLITMQFAPVDPSSLSGLPPPDWLVGRVAGTYREEFRGLYRTDWNRLNSNNQPLTTPIVAGGRFELTKVSSVGVLNDGM